jgi:hypothetical protein
MNIHQMKKVREFLKKWDCLNKLKDNVDIQTDLYNWIMVYRRNVQNLKKGNRYLKGEIARLRLSNQGDKV